MCIEQFGLTWYDFVSGIIVKKELRQRAIKLRTDDKLSYSAIKQQLGVSKSTLSYWLRDLPLSEDLIAKMQEAGWKKGEASRERYRNTMRRKKEQEAKSAYEYYLTDFEHLSDKTLFVAELMLYLGEGDKKVSSRIALSNTDPGIILFFINWLKRYFDINKEDIRIQLHLYENMDLEKERVFWQNTLELSNSQFYKSSVRKMQKSSFSYKDSIRHGTCEVYAFGVERKTKLSMAMKAFIVTSL